MGLAALALETNPVFPSFPLRMADADVTAGLVLPNAAVALLGQGGAAATLLLVFMAVTSASSAEFIAVSSIFTYDIYQTYFNPQASGKRLIYMAHLCVVGYAVLLAAFSTALFCKLPLVYHLHGKHLTGSLLRHRDFHGLSLPIEYVTPLFSDKLPNLTFQIVGVIISSAVLPATLTLMWKKQNAIAAALSPVLGLASSLIAWLVTAKKEFGNISVASTGAKYVNSFPPSPKTTPITPQIHPSLPNTSPPN
jgi:Na+/proline symporter